MAAVLKVNELQSVQLLNLKEISKTANMNIKKLYSLQRTTCRTKTAKITKDDVLLQHSDILVM